MEIKFHAFLTSVLDGGEELNSPVDFAFDNKTPSNQQQIVAIGPRVVLKTVIRKMPVSISETTPGRSALLSVFTGWIYSTSAFVPFVELVGGHAT